MSISASWLVVAVMVLRFALRRAPKWTYCLLWLLVALRLVCPILPESGVSLMPQPGVSVDSEEWAISYALDGYLPTLEFETPRDRAINHASEQAGRNVRIGNSATPSEYLPFVWAGGMLAMLIYALISYFRLRRRVAASFPVQDNIWICDDIESPFILGVFRPRIFLPSSLAEPQLSHVLAHERAHLSRHDHWWKPLGFLLLSVYWFNPLLWLSYVFLCRDIELACDEFVYRDMVISERADYSQALLDCSRSRRVITVCPLAFGEADIKGRVKAALTYKKPTFWGVAAAVLICAVVAVCFLTNPYSNRSLSWKLGVSMDMAVAKANGSPYTDGNFIATAYDVLDIKSHGGETTVYAWVHYEEFSYDGTDIEVRSSSDIPTAITFDTSSVYSPTDSSTYDVIEYWMPRDGGYYADDIRSKFPLRIWMKAFDGSGAQRRHEACLQAAREYYSTKPAAKQTTAEQSADSDVDNKIIERHFSAEVVGYGNDTLLVRVTNVLDSNLPIGEELYVPSDWDGYPLGTAVYVTYSGAVTADEEGNLGPDRTLSVSKG